MNYQKINEILTTMGFCAHVYSVTQFLSEEDGSPYQVWKLDTSSGNLVLKKTNPEEQEIYETFLRDAGPAPKVYALNHFEIGAGKENFDWK